MATDGAGRPNQKRRTRKDLLRAASRLMKRGLRPSLDEVAEEAMVSRATAYRYFPGAEALLLEASLDVAVPEPEELFPEGSPAGDPVERLERVDTALHDMMLANETALRTYLAHSLTSAADPTGDVPARQNRRMPLIEAALEPTRDHFDPVALKILCRAIALVVGTEAMVVCKDVLQLGDSEARAVKRWAIRALVAAATSDTPAG